MEQEEKFEVWDGVEVAESPLFRRERSNPYGSVPGLDDEELLGPAELERLYRRQELGPILDLPVMTKRGRLRPTIDEDGYIDWGALGTKDFERLRPKFDKRLYKADKLREEVANQRIRMETISAKIPTKAKYLVIEYVMKGILDLEDIADYDMYCLTQRYLYTKQLLREAIELEKKSRKEREEAEREFLASP